MECSIKVRTPSPFKQVGAELDHAQFKLKVLLEVVVQLFVLVGVWWVMCW